jgi:hypothetical protein
MVGGGQQVALQAAAQLARLGAASQAQAEELGRASRQLDKLQVRVRLAGQDTRRPLAQVSAAGWAALAGRRWLGGGSQPSAVARRGAAAAAAACAGLRR